MTTPVVIVKDKKSLSTLWGLAIGEVVSMFVKAWLVMVLVPVVIPFYPSYWQTFAALLVLDVAVKPDLNSYANVYMRNS